MATRPGAVPTENPEWATTLANDGLTGQPNRAEPSSTLKNFGYPFSHLKVPRQNINWLFYVLGKWRIAFEEWRDYMDQETTKSLVGVHATAFKRCYPLKNITRADGFGHSLSIDIGSIPNGSFIEVRASLKLTGSTDQYVCFGRIIRADTNLDNISFKKVAYNVEPNTNAGNNNTTSNIFIRMVSDTVFEIYNNTGAEITIEYGHIELIIIKA